MPELRLAFFLILLLFVGCKNSNQPFSVVNTDEIAVELIDSLIHCSKSSYNKSSDSIPLIDKNLKQALRIAKSNKDKRKTAELYNLIGKRNRDLCEFSKAIWYFQQSIGIAKKIADDELHAKTLHELAVVFRRMDDNAQALRLYIEALEWAEAVQDTFLIHCSLNGIGNVHFNYKDYTKAIEFYHRSLQYIGKSNPNLLGEAINTNTLGEAWLFLGNTDSAMYYLNKSFNINVQLNSKMGQAICYNGIGLVFHNKKEYSNAIDAFKAGLLMDRDDVGLFYVAMILANLGKTYLEINKYELAEKTLLEAYRISNTIGSNHEALDASNSLVRLYKETYRPNSSFLYVQKSMAFKDSITDDLVRNNNEAMNTLYKAEGQEREIVILKQNAELDSLRLSRNKNTFIAMLALLIVVSMFGLFLFRQRKLRSQINQVSLEQKLLRAQLNPHFVFNSLSAIQNFIMRNDKDAASEYLVNFSRLMRNVLMASGEDFVLLENELETLDDYLRLQQLRFQCAFNYFFELSDDIDPQSTLVPPMLIQPFIENSIEHGIRNIDREGIIIIRFNKFEKDLVIEVDDNGCGMPDQQEEKKRKKGHISMAIRITRQRMQNLQAITKRQCKFEVIDKSIKLGNSGVLVRIKLPYQED